MEDYESAFGKIRTEVKGDVSAVNEEFLEYFDKEAELFIAKMTHAFLKWTDLDVLAAENEKKQYVSSLVFSAITQQIVSLRLFLSGYIVAAGNLQRQVLETIALALLSSSKELDILDKFIKDNYSTNNAVRDALKHHSKLGVNENSLKILREARDFYHNYSHPTRLTIAAHLRFSDEGHAWYVGASFDKGKIDKYRKEVDGRVGIAGIFENFVQGVVDNVSEW